MAKVAGKGRGVSLSSKDFTKGGGLGPGPLEVTEAFFGMHDYGGTRKAVAAMFVKGERDGEEVGPEPWTVGQGWKVSEDGQYLVPKAGQTGLPSSSKAGHLLDSLEGLGMPADYLTRPEDLVGVSMVLMNKPLPKIEGKDVSVLVAESVESAPWEEGGKKKKPSGKKKPVEADDDDDAEAEDEEEDEKPARGKAGKKKPARDDDDDDDTDSDDGDDEEEEKPARGGKKPASSGDDLEEEAGEALIAALEDGPLKLKDVKTAVEAQLKGNKLAKKIAAVAADEEFLNSENGWSFNGKVVKAA